MEVAVVILSMALGVASAQMIPHGHTVPDTVPLFQKVRYTTAEGKVKQGGCEAALTAAWADLNNRLNPDKADRLIAIWPYKGRTTWEPADEVECQQKGKKTLVVMEALIARPGQGPAYPEISGNRVLEIIQQVAGGGGGSFSFALQLSIEEVDGKAWLRQSGAPYESSKPVRDGLVPQILLNNRIVPGLHEHARKLKNVPELHGLVLGQSLWDESGEKRVYHRLTLFIPRGPLLKYHAGGLNERQLIARSKIYYEGPRRPKAQVTVRPETIKLRK